MICASSVANALFILDRWLTCDHRVEASIETMNYLKGYTTNLLVQLSRRIISRNIGDSVAILFTNGLFINFPSILVHLTRES